MPRLLFSDRLASLPASFLLMLTAVSAAAAQGTTCPALVQTALDATDQFCTATGRNQLCYGNNEVELIPRDPAASVAFEQPGDLADVGIVQTLQASGMDTSVPVWGVALLRLQANIPGNLPGQNVTALVFGDAQITDAPDTQVLLPGQAPVDAPLQAFILRTGFGDAQCDEMPESGLLVQTPDGVQQVALTVNGVSVNLGSTGFFQTTTSEDGVDQLLIQMLEGTSRVESQGVAQFVVAGQQTTVVLGEDGLADSQPTDPEPYDAVNPSLPIDNLEREIEIAPPFTPSASAPIITGVVVTLSETGNTSEQISFIDQEGDAVSMSFELVGSDPTLEETSFSDTGISVPQAQQQVGGVVYRETNCAASDEPFEALVRITINDAAGNVSNPVEYRVTCGEPG
jgi:hypothetical protein